MKTRIKIEKEVEIKTLHVKSKVRYWEDTEVNNQQDELGELIPCREGNLWCPVIDIDKGIILNWEKGKTAKIHYKVCDAGSYYLKDENGDNVASIEGGYVPSILCPEDEGYGDYIIMNVLEDGQIQNWQQDISSFLNAD